MAESFNYYGNRGNTTDVYSQNAPATQPMADTGMAAYLKALEQLKYQKPAQSAQERPMAAQLRAQAAQKAAPAPVQRGSATGVEQTPRFLSMPVSPGGAGASTWRMGEQEKMVSIGGQLIPFSDYLAMQGKGSGGGVTGNLGAPPSAMTQGAVATPSQQEMYNRMGLSADAIASAMRGGR